MPKTINRVIMKQHFNLHLSNKNKWILNEFMGGA